MHPVKVGVIVRPYGRIKVCDRCYFSCCYLVAYVLLSLPNFDTNWVLNCNLDDVFTDCIAVILLFLLIIVNAEIT